MNCEPSTYKSPLILTLPLVVPIPAGAGSIIIFSGPKSVAVVVTPLAIETPVPTVLNLSELS